MSKPGYPLVSFACNSPETGELSGLVTGVELFPCGDPVFQLEGEAEYAQDEAGLRVRVAGAWFAVKGPFRRWAGNWCWNAVELEPHTLAALLTHLRGQEWDCVCAEEGFMSAWDAGQPLTAELLEAAC